VCSTSVYKLKSRRETFWRFAFGGLGSESLCLRDVPTSVSTCTHIGWSASFLFMGEVITILFFFFALQVITILNFYNSIFSGWTRQIEKRNRKFSCTISPDFLLHYIYSATSGKGKPSGIWTRIQKWESFN